MDLNRPVFRTDDFQDIDEGWQWGAYIGGMAGAYEDAGIASSYIAAADQLTEQAISDERVHEVVLPVLFLYRHAIELRLKGAVRPSEPDHDVPRLLAALNEKLVAAGASRLPVAVTDRIRELAGVDPRADAFRFHRTKARKATRRAPETPSRPHFPEEVWVDVAHLRDVMRVVDQELVAAAAVVGTD